MEIKKPARLGLIELLGMSIIVVLLLQFIVGMYTNLFVEIPENTSGWSIVGSSSVLFSHIVLGILLTATAVLHLVLSIKRKKTVWVFFSVIGLIAMIASLYFGSAFMGDHLEFESYMMSIGTALAFLAYLGGVYISCRTQQQ